ncbi:MAG: hypothetical protein ACRC0X_10285, partial [Brevinema sp.]
PILVLDREGGDFYRYYEYRIIEANRFVGAIRIPTYRRTENFATSEVHVYSADEKTYTIHPTGWGYHMTSALIQDEDTDFYNYIKKLSNPILTENLSFNVAYFLHDNFSLNEKVSPIDVNDVYNQLYNEYKQHGNVMNGTKGVLSSDDKKLIFDAAARKDTLTHQDDLTKVKELMFTLESVAMLSPTVSNTLACIIPNFVLANYYSGIATIYSLMTDNNSNTFLTKILKTIYWEHVENHSTDLQLSKYMLELELNVFQELDKKHIKPIVEYPKYSHYPQVRQNNLESLGFLFEKYQLISVDRHTDYIESRIGFLSPSGFRASLLQPVSNSDGQEFDSAYLDNIYKTSLNRTFNKKTGVKDDSLLSIGVLPPFQESAVLDLLNSVGKLIGTVGPWIDIYNNKIVDENGNYSHSNAFLFVIKNGVINSLFGLWTTVIKVKYQIEAISDALDKVLANLEQILGKEGMLAVAKVLDRLGGLFPELPFKQISAVLKYYVTNGPGMVKQVFLHAFDSWTVWWVPIFFFPTGWWTVDKGNGVLCPPRGYAYRMGLPTIWRFDLSNIVPPDRNPTMIAQPPVPEPPAHPDEELVPDDLKEYKYEWLSMYRWLQENKLYEFDTEGNQTHYTHLATTDIGNIIESFNKDLYVVYEELVPVFIDKNNPYAEITNVDDKDKTNIISNIISSPSKLDKDEQSQWNLNQLANSFNTQYNLTITSYKGFKE